MSESQLEKKNNKFRKFIAEYANVLTNGTIIIGIILIIVFILLLGKCDRTFVNILSIIGTIASVFGLTIAIIQIVSLKEISVVTQRTIHETKDKLILGISISDVTETIKLIQEIENYVGNEKFEIARLKLIDLKEKVIQFKFSKEFSSIVQGERIKEIIDLLNIEISTLYLFIYNNEENLKYNFESLSGPLQEVFGYLSEFKNQIKYNTVL